MSATAAPYGFRPVRSLSSGGYNSGHNRLYKVTDDYATSIFYGDLVAIANTGTIGKATATTAANFLGVFVGCTYTDPTLNYKLHSNMWLGGTTASDIMAYVVDDPHMVYQAQSSTTVAQTVLGNNIDLVQTAGNTNIGMSRVALDGGNISDSVTTKMARVIGFVDGPDSAVGDAYTDCLVILNPLNHQLIADAGI